VKGSIFIPVEAKYVDKCHSQLELGLNIQWDYTKLVVWMQPAVSQGREHIWPTALDNGGRSV